MTFLGPLANGFFLLVSRFAGFSVVAPFPEASRTQKLSLVCALAWVMAPAMNLSQVPKDLSGALVASAFAEVLAGLTLGLFFRLSLVSADMLGGVLSHATGLATPSVLDPNSGVHDTALTRVVTLFAILVAFGIGAHRVALYHLLTSMDTLPLGSVLNPSGSSLFLFESVRDALTLGVELSMPVLATSLVVQAALGIVARVAPSMQLFNVGLSVMVAAGFWVFGASLRSVGTRLAERFLHVGEGYDPLLRLLGS